MLKVPFFAQSCGPDRVGTELMYANTHTKSVQVSGASRKCRPVSSLIALPIMRDGAIDQDLPEERNITHTQYSPVFRLWSDGAIFGTLFLKLCVLTENKSFEFLNVSHTNTLPTAHVTRKRHSHSHSVSLSKYLPPSHKILLRFI